MTLGSLVEHCFREAREQELAKLARSQAELAELAQNPGPRKKKPDGRRKRRDQPRDELGQWASPKKRK